MDRYDRAILNALQADGSLTNAALSEAVNLSASQCSRRRAALEREGLITGYGARLDAAKLGLGLRAVVRVNLRAHGRENEAAFALFLQRRPEVRAAHSVSGDADYIVDVQVPDLAAFAEFIHSHLLPLPQVAQVRSEIVLKPVKADAGLPVGLAP